MLLLYIQNQLLPKTDGRVDETPLKLKLQRVQSAISLIKLEDKLLKTLLEIFEKVCIKRERYKFCYENGLFGFFRVSHVAEYLRVPPQLEIISALSTETSGQF